MNASAGESPNAGNEHQQPAPRPNEGASFIDDSSNRLLIFTGFLAVVGMLILVVFSPEQVANRSDQEFVLRAFSTHFALAAGACALFALFGFLFGIPRTITSEADDLDSEDGRRTVRYLPSNSLEQVSDWVTKIIIGVGLVELGDLAQEVNDFALEVSKSVTGNENAKAYVLFVLIYHGTAGFIAGYLWTRLKYAVALKNADEKAMDTRVAKVEENVGKIADSLLTDQRVIMAVSDILSGGPEVNQDQFTQDIRNATSNARVRAFWDADTVLRSLRNQNTEARKVMANRTARVFAALADADQEGLHLGNRRNLIWSLLFAQEWEKAKTVLYGLLHLLERGGKGKGEAEFALAYVNIMVTQTPPIDAIKAHIAKALDDGWIVQRWGRDRYTDWRTALLSWMTTNNMSPQDYGLSVDGLPLEIQH